MRKLSRGRLPAEGCSLPFFEKKKKNSNFFEFGAFGGGKKAQQREIMGEAEEEELQELQELQGELAGAGSGHKTPRQAAGAASHRG